MVTTHICIKKKGSHITGLPTPLHPFKLLNRQERTANRQTLCLLRLSFSLRYTSSSGEVVTWQQVRYSSQIVFTETYAFVTQLRKPGKFTHYWGKIIERIHWFHLFNKEQGDGKLDDTVNQVATDGEERQAWVIARTNVASDIRVAILTTLVEFGLSFECTLTPIWTNQTSQTLPQSGPWRSWRLVS